jgi:alkylation response protein AidB-like acyl-CoA dehydrogenase
MLFRSTPELDAWRDEVRSFLRDEMRDADAHADPTDLTGLTEAFERAHQRRAGARGFLGISAPTQFGGGGRPPSWKAVYSYEAAYHDAPSIDTALTLAGSAIETFGSDAQKAHLLPAMVRGEIEACIAYTEPHAGSDLAALSTTADAVDDGFVLNGEKALITGAHKADWCVTIARTDRDAPARQSMTMFVLPMTTPGVTCRRRVTANQWTLSEIVFTDAHVPATAVLGAVGRGWQQVTAALADERSGMAHLGWATRLHELLVDRARPHGDPLVADRLAQLDVELSIARRFASRVMAVQDAGQRLIAEASMAKIYVTELLQRLALTGVDLLGADGLWHEVLFGPRAGAPLRGRFAYEVIERIHPTVSVGANEIQRDTIARFGLQLPERRA